MNRNRVLIALCLFTFGASVVLSAGKKPEEALMQADRDFAEATRTKGVEGWVSYFAENGAMLRDQPITGKEAIRAAMKPFLSTKGLIFTWKPTRAGLLPAADMGYTVGRYSITLPDKDGKPATRTGGYITVWKKQKDGYWRVLADAGSPDPPKPKL